MALPCGRIPAILPGAHVCGSRQTIRRSSAAKLQSGALSGVDAVSEKARVGFQLTPKN